MRTIALAASAALALALVGCASSPEPSPQPEPQPGITDAPSTPETDTPSEHPCGYATAEQFQQIFGIDLGEGRLRTASTVTVQGVTWHPQTCVWDLDDLEVEIAVADAEAFETGELSCIEPLGIGSRVEPVGGIGEQAWWEYDDTDEGELRACTADHVVDIEIDGDDIDARTAAIELMQLVLATLG